MITTHTLLQLIGKYAPLDRGTLLVGELGGGGSCFLTKVRNAISPAQYHVIDKSQLGLRRLHEQIGNDDTVFLHSEDILNLKETLQLDLVFSVGLIEHFSIEDSRKAVEAHFKILKPGGVAIIAFPTPTLLYKTTRFLIEMLGLWIFYDERPIKRAEVATTFARYGNILHEKIIWPILLTQMIVVVKKRGY